MLVLQGLISNPNSGQQDHRPVHIHVRYQDGEAAFDVEEGVELLFEGPLQGDCYSAHYTLAKYPKLVLVGCMAHMRRYFTEALALGERRYSPLIIRYTLVENCKRHGLDPYVYLKDVLTRLPAGDPTAAEVAHLTPAMEEDPAGDRRSKREVARVIDHSGFPGGWCGC